MGALEILTVSTIITFVFFITIRYALSEFRQQIKEIEEDINTLNSFKSRIETIQFEKVEHLKLQLEYLVKVKSAKNIEVGFSVYEIMHIEYFPEYLNSWRNCKIVLNESLLNYEIKMIE